MVLRLAGGGACAPYAPHWIRPCPGPEGILIQFDDHGETTTTTNRIKVSALVPGTIYTCMPSKYLPLASQGEVKMYLLMHKLSLLQVLVYMYMLAFMVVVTF